MRLPHQKKIAILSVFCCVLTCITAISPVHAKSSRTLTIALLASGVGLKFGSVFVEKSAQEAYDQYLNSAIQADIAKHRDDYTSKHNFSVAMSRTGIGFVGLAMLISIFDELDLISKTSRQDKAANLRSTEWMSERITTHHSPLTTHAICIIPAYNPRTHETVLLLQHQF